MKRARMSLDRARASYDRGTAASVSIVAYEVDLRRFFIPLIDDRGVSAGTVNIYRSGIKFFYEKTLRREWLIFRLIRRNCLKLKY